MPIPLPVLDDLSFSQLMDEARTLIIRYAPQWTDHNISDPGIMLLELFAWLSETFMFRADQITDKHIEAFLHFIGHDEARIENVRNAVINAALSVKDRRRAITADDCEYLAMKQMNAIRPGLGGRAAVVVNRNLDLEESGETEKIGHTSVIIFPNDSITIEIYEKIKRYVESGHTSGWSNGEEIIARNIDDLRESRTAALLAFIDSNDNHLYPAGIRFIMETLKEGLINTFEKYLRDGIKDGIDYRLAHLTDQYLEDLIDKIRKFLNDKKSEKLPQTILSYIEYCKECIKKRYIKLLCEKSSGRKIYDDNAERIREEIRKNIQKFLDTGDSSWTTDTNLIEELSNDLTSISENIADNLLHKEGVIYNERLILEIEKFRTAASDAVRSYVRYNTVNPEFESLIRAFIEYKERLKQTIKAVLFPGTVVEYPVDLPDDLMRWLKETTRDIIDELLSHVIDAIEDEVQSAFEESRLLTHRIHVVQPVKYPVGIRITVEIQKTAIWTDVRESIFRQIKEFLDPVSGGPSKKGWPIARSLYNSELCQVVESVPGVDHTVSISMHPFNENDPEQIKKIIKLIEQVEGNDSQADLLIDTHFGSDSFVVPLLTKRYFVPLINIREQRSWI